MLKEFPNKNGIEIEAAQAVQNTMCLNLVDFYSRRVPAFLAQANHGLQSLDSVGAIFKEQLGWSAEKLENEKERYRKYIENELQWKK